MDLVQSKPNILILSRGFRAGDAITTLNLFSKWPEENLFCASLVESEYADKICGFYFLGHKEVKYKFPFNHFSRPKESHIGLQGIEKRNNSTSILGKIYNLIGRPILQWLDLYETRLSINVSLEFEAWLTSINPIAVYTSVGDIAMARFILEFHKKFPSIKIIVHGFDDWLSPTYSIINGKSHRKKAETLFKKVLSIASGRFTATQKMAQEYASRYGYEFSVFTNPAPISSINYIVEKAKKPNILFIGKVGWHNNDALRLMINAIEKITHIGHKVCFDIYTDTPTNELKKLLGKLPEQVIVHEPVPNSQITSILLSAHVLYLPISINDQNIRFTRFSMSTKMGEYLNAGVPMIYLGPKNIAMTEFLEVHDCAEIITENSVDELTDRLIHVLKSPDHNKLENGKKIALKYFNKDIVSNNFSKAIYNICVTNL